MKSINKKGISIVSLVIIVIVIIILAAIVIFEGIGGTQSAEFARFTQEFSSFQEEIDQRYIDVKSDNAFDGRRKKAEEIYAEMGSEPEEISTRVPYSILPKEIEGTNCYKLLDSRTFYEEDGGVYVTDEGEIFTLPGYKYSISGEERYYVSANKYYIDDSTTSGGNNGVYEGVNSPILVENMIPVYYDGTVWRKADSTNKGVEKWYDYEAKRWANIVTVTSATRNNYSNANIGDEIDEEDVLGYFVWIPRYAYKISGQHIDVKFLKGTTNEFEGGTVGQGNDYITHPVFTNNPSNGGWNKELNGIWVAKFEASSSETRLENDSYDYITIKVNPGTTVRATGNGKRSSTNRNWGRVENTLSEFVTVRPNVTSWRSTAVPDISAKSKQMATAHGINVDSHIMKNTEWGAVAYLTQSDYGNSNVWNNPYNEGEIYEGENGNYGMYSYADTITGMVGESRDDSTNYFAEKISKTYNSDGTITIGYKNINSNGNVGEAFSKRFYPYNSTNGFNGSTTGNIYGIYDMAGGAWEYTAAYVNNNSNNLALYVGDLTGKYANIYEASSSDTGNATPSEATKLIADENYELSSSIKGDAVFETSTSGSSSTASWNGDYARFPHAGYPFFMRGGNFIDTSSAGVFAFSRAAGNGGTYSGCGFRVVLVP